MIRPTKATADGRAYLELQNLARKERKVTGELLTMYVVERWLARLAISAYRDDFVLKGGMLLASFGARRPTADADALARNMAADEQTVVQRVVDIALIAMPEDGVRFDADSVRAQQIREEAVYAGTRVRMDAHLATADVRLSLDINFGDPVTPGPQPIQLPPLRPGMEPISILGYPVETVIAEKLMTAVALGATNTRVRDYADIWTLTSSHPLDRATMWQALHATSTYRATPIEPLSAVVGSIGADRNTTYTAYRRQLGPDGEQLPRSFHQVIVEVVAFADPLLAATVTQGSWDPSRRRWRSSA